MEGVIEENKSILNVIMSNHNEVFRIGIIVVVIENQSVNDTEAHTLIGA